MPTFSRRSLSHLDECHSDIQVVLKEAIKYFDFSVIEGYRNEAEQNRAKYAGYSNADFGESPHNFEPSYAVDIIPYPFMGWGNTDQFYRLAGGILAISKSMDKDIIWGGDFKSFFDGPHFEIRHWKDLI